MATSKQDANDALFVAACERVEVALKARKTPDEVTCVSVEGLSIPEITSIQLMYRQKGWTVTYEYCTGEYEDLWFS